MRDRCEKKLAAGPGAPALGPGMLITASGTCRASSADVQRRPRPSSGLLMGMIRVGRADIAEHKRRGCVDPPCIRLHVQGAPAASRGPRAARIGRVVAGRAEKALRNGAFLGSVPDCFAGRVG